MSECKLDPIVNEPEVIEQVTPVEVVTETVPKPGEKTDSALLLKSLQEERNKRKQLEADLALERAKERSEQVAFSDEGKSILSVVNKVQTELESTKKELAMKDLVIANPALKDKGQEFEDYLSQNPGMRLETAAKAFIIENDLVEAPPTRKGLEKASGGGRTQPQTGMTPGEIDNLRVTNYREYAKRIKNGTLK